MESPINQTPSEECRRADDVLEDGIVQYPLTPLEKCREADDVLEDGLAH